MADLRTSGPLRSLLVPAEEIEKQQTNSQLLSDREGFVPDINTVTEAGQFSRGAKSGRLGLQAGQFFRKADQAEAAGDTAKMNSLREHARRIEENAGQAGPRVASAAGIENLKDLADFAAGGLGQLAPTMIQSTIPAVAGGIAGFAVGGPIGAAAGAAIGGGTQSFSMGAGEAAQAQQADEFIRGLPVEDRLREQRTKGLSEAALELAFPALLGGRLTSTIAKAAGTRTASQAAKAAGKSAVDEATADVIPRTHGQIVRDAGISVFREAGVEGATEAAQTQAGFASLSRLNPNRDRSGDAQALIDATILGAMGGGTLSGLASVPTTLYEISKSNEAAAPRTFADEINEDGSVKPGAGERIRDSFLKEAAATAATVKATGAKVADSVLDAAARTGEKIKTRVRPPQSPPQPPPPPPPSSGGASVIEGESARVSDAELERRSRLKKSMFGETAAQAIDEGGGLNTPEQVAATEQARAAADEEFRASTRFEASAEEITGLRELHPVSKDEAKGHRRRVLMNEDSVNKHLADLVARGTITQDVADSAKVEPLGTNMKRKGASVQEMENEIAGIVRDLMSRIGQNKRVKGSDREGTINDQLHELRKLPIDIQRRDEKTHENTANTNPTIEEKQVKKKKTETDGQGELFPGDIGKTFPVTLKEFKQNHFGLSADLVRDEPKQLELGLKKEGETYQDLLVRALDNYGVVLASDAAVDEQAASPAATKSHRSALDTADREARAGLESGNKILKLQLKNGKTELLDTDSLAQSELARDREGVAGNLRSTQKIKEAGLASALASELLREDVEGIIDPKTGKVVTGIEGNKLLTEHLAAVAAGKVKNARGVQTLSPQEKRILAAEKRRAGTRAFIKKTPAANRAILNKGRRALGQYESKNIADDQQAQFLAESPKRATIQRAFNAVRKSLRTDRALANELRKSFELTNDDSKTNKEGMTETQILEELRDKRDQFTKLAREQRDVLQKLREMQAEVRKNREDNTAGNVTDKDFIAAMELKYGKEAADKTRVPDPELSALFHSKAAAGTAKFRADRFEALVAEINDILAEAKRDGVQEANQAEVGGQAETLNEKGVRHAEDQTGAGTQLKVGQRFGGEQRHLPPTGGRETAGKQQSKFAELEQRLLKATTATEVRRLLGGIYASVQKGLYQAHPIILLGETAQGAVRDHLLSLGVEIMGVGELQASTFGENRNRRVIVMLTPSDAAKMLKDAKNSRTEIQNKQLLMLLESGVQIIMPGITEEMKTLLKRNGYKGKRQFEESSTVWTPEISAEAGATPIRVNPSAAAISNIALASITFGDLNKFAEKLQKAGNTAAKIAAEAAVKVAEQAAKAAENAKPLVQAAKKAALETTKKASARIKDGVSDAQIAAVKSWMREQFADSTNSDIDVMIENAREKLLASVAEGSVMAKLWAETVKMLEKAKESASKKWTELEADAQAYRAEFRLGQQRQVEAQVRAETTVDVVALRFQQANPDVTADEALAWATENHEVVIAVLVRRTLLETFPVAENDIQKLDGSAFSANITAQAAVIEKVFGAKVAKRIGISGSMEETLRDNYDVTFEGEKIVIGKGALTEAQITKLTPAGMWVMGYLQKAPLLGSYMNTRIFFGEVEKFADRLIRYLDYPGPKAPQPLTTYTRSTDKFANVTGSLNSVVLRTRDEIITHFFGPEHVGKPTAELMNLKFLPTDTVGILKRAMPSAVEDTMRRALAGKNRKSDVSADMDYSRFNTLPTKMTLNIAKQARAWMEANSDKIDVSFKGNIEGLVMAPPSFAELFGMSAHGMFEPVDDRITLFANAMKNEFMLTWVAWHELHHRGIAVKYGAETKAMLETAARNPTIAKIAKAIRAERAIMGDKMGSTELGAVEEALVEIAAALNTGNWNWIKEQYGVEVSENLKRPLTDLVAQFIELMKKVMNNLLKQTDAGIELQSDIQVLEILRDVRQAALFERTNRKQGVQSLQAKDIEFEGMKFSKQFSSLKDRLSEMMGIPVTDKFVEEFQQRSPEFVAEQTQAAINRQINTLKSEIADTNKVLGLPPMALARKARERGVSELAYKRELTERRDRQELRIVKLEEQAKAAPADNVIDSKRFSKQSSPTGTAVPLTAAQRQLRKDEVKKYLATVLGQAIADKFSDVLTVNTDSAGSFDWKTAVIELAIDTMGYMGTAKHEAFHAFFHKMGKLEGNHRVYKRLLAAANAPHIKKQLREILKNSPEALKQLADPEERLAYMFQFYATGKLTLTPATWKTFRKWGRALAELVGYVSKMDTAERIFTAFEAGNLRTNFQIRDMLALEQHRGLAKSMQPVMDALKLAFNATLTTATDRLRDTNNRALGRIADLFAPEVRKGGAAGFIAQKAQVEAQFRNQLNDIMDKHKVPGETAEQAEIRSREALELLQGQEDVIPGSLAADLRQWMQDVYVYLRDPAGDTVVQTANGTVTRTSPNAVHQLVFDTVSNKMVWEPIANSGPKYFPRIWDAKTVLDNWSEFIDDATAATMPTLAPGAPPHSAGKIAARRAAVETEMAGFKAALAAGDGMMEIGQTDSVFDAAMRAVNSRTFDFITEQNADVFSKYQEKDLANILTTYARQAAHRGEQTRHFGFDNGKLKSLLADAKAEGATPAELKMADKAIRALEGTLGANKLSPLMKGAMMTAMTAVNFAVLPLALFSSLVDPLGVLVRTGSASGAWNTFKAGVRQIYAEMRGNVTDGQKMAEFLGLVEQEQMLSVVGDTQNSMFQNETLRKWNAAFFKIIGLDAWTKGTRIGAMFASMLYMRDNATNAAFLEEVGLQAGDIVMRDATTVEHDPKVLGSEKARRVQAAINRMVNESILRPTAGQRPIYMSDHRFIMMGHLKQFTFSFHNTIIKQVASNVNAAVDNAEYGKAMTALVPLLSYVPFMMAADLLRAAVGGRLDDDDEEKTLGEQVQRAIQRSSILGVYTFGLDAGTELGFGQLPINTFLGPVAGKTTRLVEAGIDPDEGIARPAIQMLPGYAFWKGWMQ